MPPSRHSSSHHSSSHHSSHSSSHHSSSRSHSSHSSSSHSSSYRSSSGSYGSLFRSSSGSSRSTAPVRRTRSSQPYGWNNKVHGSVGHYYCSTHDYDYYPQDWTAQDGRQFKEGYYDENGQHYENMAMIGGTTMLKCSYCGNRMLHKWVEGDLPVCDKCGAQLKIDITDKEEKSYSGHSGNTTTLKDELKKVPLIGKIAIGVFLCCMILPIFIIFAALFLIVPNKDSYDTTRYETSSVKNSIHVDEINRTCYLDGEDWYDSQTECWFYYNDTASPAQWQYWYEGISSDYGDYGWMEYDSNENAWYIETNDGNWVHLPSAYDTTKLWHMTDEYTNTYD
ncbi:MAG: hypothetical protein J5525_08005 [Lachnospiraceae bacterium]|nr:hypothetical protein [Lachnospiraceae bacterium]